VLTKQPSFIDHDANLVTGLKNKAKE